MQTIERISRALRRYNAWELIALFAYNVSLSITRKIPSSIRLKFAEPDFDLSHGTDTSAQVGTEEFEVSKADLEGAVHYETMTLRRFRKVIRSVGTDLTGRVFIDFGSGKGRLLLMASEYPFQRVIGVEFEPNLHAIAKRNVQLYTSSAQRCRDIRPICGNAVTFEIPPERLICSFNNPFDDRILSQVVANLEESLDRSEREVYVIYANPIHRDLFDDSPRWELIAQKFFAGFAVYRNVPRA